MSESGNNRQQSAASSLSKELFVYCDSDSLSKEGLHEIIERYLTPNKNSHDVSDYEFFLRACINKRVNEGIIRCLLEYFPDVASATDDNGWSPLYYACNNIHLTLNIVQLLIDAAPDYVCHADNNGWTPLHSLCSNTLDESVALEILELLIMKCPDAIRHANNKGVLPIHCAGGSGGRSPEFCSVLIEAYPGSERMTDVNDNLPFHYACLNNTLATVEYFYKLYPDAINQTTTRGLYPIHTAIIGVIKKRKSLSPSGSVNIVKFLLECDPNVKLQKVRGKSSLHYACRLSCNDSNIDAALEVIQAIYDAHPEAIEDNTMASTIDSYHQQVQTFINSQLVYSRRARDHRLMTTPDGNGRLPLHTALQNNVRLGSIKLLVKGNPSAIRNSDTNFAMPLHIACQHHNSSNVVQYLIGLDTSTNSIRSVNSHGRTPLHSLCANKILDETSAMEILKLLIEKHPDAVRHATNNNGCLPIHLAAGWGRRSPEFCSVLIEAYPGSQRMTDVNGNLPLHLACAMNTVATVEYLYKLYPDAINQTTTNGFYPIHTAILGVTKKSESFRPSDSVDIVEFLLECDPGVKLQKVGRNSPLHYACHLSYNDSKIEAVLEVLQAIYDFYPEAIEDDAIASEIQHYHQQVQSFLNGELVYSRQAKNFRLMTIPDDNGRLPLHRALQNIASLGSIKLLVKGNPPALQTPDNHGALPLHVACQHHDSASVVQYLVRLDATTLNAVDRDGNTALHYACRSAKYDNIALLLETYDAVSVSKRNDHGKLPIDLLWESSGVDDRGSVEYTESIFRLLKAYPETVMVMNIDMQQQQPASASCPSQNGKKRKFADNEE